MADNHGKILIVEDEKKISDISRAYLERDGFAVRTAATGAEAIKLIKERFDLVILDLMLPDMPGEELCRMIRETSDVPVIILTAKSSEEDRIQGLGMGADDYVVKPFSPRELVARVKAHLRRTMKAQKTMSFNKGGLVIDIEKHQVKAAGSAVTLTPTEFRILLSLAERPENVLSRLQLVNMVQGYDFEGYERTMDAHVKNLRQKIERNPKSPEYIKTVYGVGYKFAGVRDEG